VLNIKLLGERRIVLLRDKDESYIRSLFDSISSSYGLFKGEGRRLLSNFEEQQILVEILDQTDSTASVLEVGCGWNRYLSVISRQASTAVGIDLSKQMLESGKKRFPELDIDLIQADMTHLPFRDCIFNLAYSIRAFKYSHNPTQVLREIRRVCKKPVSIMIYEINNCLSFAYLEHLIRSFLRFLVHTSISSWQAGISTSTPFLMKKYFEDACCGKVFYKGILYIPQGWYSSPKCKRVYKKFIFLERSIPSFFSILAYGILYETKTRNKRMHRG
jgi:ubiquinone/menaquinone biosynthesis C-methylase UbiE